MPRSPGSRTFLLASLTPRIDDAVRPVGLARISATGLTVATTARTTRFCRTRSAPFVYTRPRTHRDYPPCPHPLVPTLPRPPQPGPRFERLANRPSSSGRAVSMYAAIPNFGKVEYFCEEGLTGGGVFCPTGNPAATASPQLPTVRTRRGRLRFASGASFARARSHSRKLTISGQSAVPSGAISQSPRPDPSLIRSQR